MRALGGGSLLIANHQSKMDPFVITMHLPFYAYLRILPIRFPTSHDIYTHPLFNPHFFPLLTFFGCYTIGTTSQSKMLALFYTRGLLKKGYAVFLFPEGKIVKEKNVQEFQKGVEFFKYDANNVMFVRTHGFHEEKNVSFLLGKRRINFSDILHVPLAMNLDEMKVYLETL
jgi:1-acyl-sn-glycerol-3-phosphate acyltransferase